jgi:thymidylate synthase
MRALGTKTWDANANENAAWLKNERRNGEDDLGLIYGAVAKNWPVVVPDGEPHVSYVTDLFHKVYKNLREGRDDRGEIITFWNPGMFHLGCLRPCMYEHQFSLLGDDLYLNSTQRSNDLPLGCTANMIQVWLFLRLMAQITGKNPKFAHHRSVNSHIYKNQLELVPVQLEREMLAEPTIDINPDIKTLEDLETWVTLKDFEITYPEFHPAIRYPFAV